MTFILYHQLQPMLAPEEKIGFCSFVLWHVFKDAEMAL